VVALLFPSLVQCICTNIFRVRVGVSSSIDEMLNASVNMPEPISTYRYEVYVDSGSRLRVAGTVGGIVQLLAQGNPSELFRREYNFRSERPV
jgi:hypothetical protein